MSPTVTDTGASSRLAQVSVVSRLRSGGKVRAPTTVAVTTAESRREVVWRIFQ